MTDNPFSKFQNTQDLDLYGDTVFGWEGAFPVVGAPAPFMTQAEVEEAPKVGHFRSQFFCLWKDGDKTKFDKVMDHVVAGEFFIRARVDIPVPDAPGEDPGGSLKIYLEWVQVTIQTRPTAASLPMPSTAVTYSVPL